MKREWFDVQNCTVCDFFNVLGAENWPNYLKFERYDVYVYVVYHFKDF